jgi:hypothetical protein
MGGDAPPARTGDCEHRAGALVSTLESRSSAMPATFLEESGRELCDAGRTIDTVFGDVSTTRQADLGCSVGEGITSIHQHRGGPPEAESRRLGGRRDEFASNDDLTQASLRQRVSKSCLSVRFEEHSVPRVDNSLVSFAADLHQVT